MRRYTLYVIPEHNINSVSGCSCVIKDFTIIRKITYTYGIPIDFCQAGAIIKRIVANTCDAVADGNHYQAGATTKRSITNACGAVADRNGLDFRAV